MKMKIDHYSFLYDQNVGDTPLFPLEHEFFSYHLGRKSVIFSIIFFISSIYYRNVLSMTDMFFNLHFFTLMYIIEVLYIQ